MQKHATDGRRGKTRDHWQARGKHVTDGKRGKTRNQWQARKNSPWFWFCTRLAKKETGSTSYASFTANHKYFRKSMENRSTGKFMAIKLLQRKRSEGDRYLCSLYDIRTKYRQTVLRTKTLNTKGKLSWCDMKFSRLVLQTLYEDE